MKIFRFIVLIVVLTSHSAFSTPKMSPYEKMQCVFNSMSDDPESCLLGSKVTVCGTIKCLKTIGQHCTTKPNEIKINGNECGKDLICDCDRKCSGCMNVNGEQKCRYAENCIPGSMMGKRNQQLPETFDYVTGHDKMVAMYP